MPIAMTSVILLAAIGGAIDFSAAASTRSAAQKALDPAVVAAATLLSRNISPQDVVVAAETHFKMAAPAECIDGARFTVDETGVTGSVECASTTFFAGFVGFDTVDVSADARAEFPNGAPEVVPARQPKCLIMALDQFGTGGIHIDESSSIIAPDCKVYSRFASGPSIEVANNGGIVAESICTATATNAADGDAALVHDGGADCPALDNPLEGTPAPPEYSWPCEHTDMDIRTDTTLSPGVYCGNFYVRSEATATLEPGLYLFDNVDLLINYGSLVGEDVFLYLKGADSSIQFSEWSTIRLSGHKTGVYEGLVIKQEAFASNPATGVPESQNLIAGSEDSIIDGAVYFPTGHVTYEGNMFAGAWFSLVANKITVQNGATLYASGDFADGQNWDGLQKFLDRFARLEQAQREAIWTNFADSAFSDSPYTYVNAIPELDVEPPVPPDGLYLDTSRRLAGVGDRPILVR